MQEPIFRTEYRVIYGDTDAGSVVYNANYLRFFEMGRTEMMRTSGMPYSEIEKQDLIIPVTEAYLRYKAPAVYDDLITIATTMAEVTKVSCRFHYRITKQIEDRELLLVKGFTKHACVNRQGKLTPFSPEIRERMNEILQRENA
jgi:acyl-CoA thioester hydrolase